MNGKVSKMPDTVACWCLYEQARAEQNRAGAIRRPQLQVPIEAFRRALVIGQAYSS